MPRNKTAATIALEAISKKSGLGIKHLRELHREGGMPIMPTHAALHWLENRPEKSPATSSVEALRLARLRLVDIQSQAAQLRLETERNQMLTRDEVRMQHSAGGHAVRSMLLALELGLPPLIVGKSVAQAQEIIRHQLRLVMAAFQDSQSDFWREHPLDETKLK